MGMFGLDSGKKKKPDEVFDLEIDLKDPIKAHALHEKVEARLQKIKEVLRAGSSQEDLKVLSEILHGYTSLIKVYGRAIARKK